MLTGQQTFRSIWRPSFLHRVVDLSGKLWALPNTVIGLAAGVTGWVAGCLAQQHPRILLGHNAIQFLNCPLVLKGRAICLGNVVLYAHGVRPDQYGAYGDRAVNLGLHEEAHTYQSQVCGVLFLLVYLAAGGFCGPQRNPFERAAQEYGSGRGSWWPRTHLQHSSN